MMTLIPALLRLEIGRLRRIRRATRRTPSSPPMGAPTPNERADAKADADADALALAPRAPTWEDVLTAGLDWCDGRVEDRGRPGVARPAHTGGS